jgi:hypothetical protein
LVEHTTIFQQYLLTNEKRFFSNRVKDIQALKDRLRSFVLDDDLLPIPFFPWVDPLDQAKPNKDPQRQ